MSAYNNLIDFKSQKPNYVFNFSVLGQKRSISVIQDFTNEGSIASVLWDCEAILSHYLIYTEQQSQRWSGKTCIELGAGCALAASLLWHLGATVVATDLPKVVEEVTQLNVHNVFEETSRVTQLAKRRHCYAAAPLEWGNDKHAEDLDKLLLAKMGAVKKKTIAVKASNKAVSKKKTQQQSKADAAATAKNSNNDDDAVKKGEDNDEDELVFDVAASDRLTESQIDYIFGADVIYHSDQHAILMRSLLTLMNEHTVFVFVHRKRNEHDTNFIDALKKTFDILRHTSVGDVLKSFPKPQTITIFEFGLKKQ